uniref:Uncharacterized protein n=1 Tax=Sphaerodactylus townsendi TaxID=933632 RepID=A0ACB8FN76_9SAUR
MELSDQSVLGLQIRDEWGNKIWICPGCEKPDDGSPMIGCDGCDDWYHWPCVGLTAAPPEEMQWFCSSCPFHHQAAQILIKNHLPWTYRLKSGELSNASVMAGTSTFVNTSALSCLFLLLLSLYPGEMGKDLLSE